MTAGHEFMGEVIDIGQRVSGEGHVTCVHCCNTIGVGRGPPNADPRSADRFDSAPRHYFSVSNRVQADLLSVNTDPPSPLLRTPACRLAIELPAKRISPDHPTFPGQLSLKKRPDFCVCLDSQSSWPIVRQDKQPGHHHRYLIPVPGRRKIAKSLKLDYIFLLRYIRKSPVSGRQYRLRRPADVN